MPSKYLLTLLLLILSSVGLTYAQEAPCPPGEILLANTPAPPSGVVGATMLAQRVYPEDTEVLVLGDSIAVLLDPAMKSAFPNSKVTTLATGGASFAQAQFELNYGWADLKAMDPKVILVILGTNALNQDPCASLPALRSYLANVRNLWPETSIEYVSILPRGSFFDDMEDKRLQMNAALADLEKQGEIGLITVDENSLTCGIHGSPRLDELKTLLNGTTKDAAMCGDRNKTELRSEIKTIVGGNSDVGLTCSQSARLSCTNYAADNIHLSEPGTQELIQAIVTEITPYLE